MEQEQIAAQNRLLDAAIADNHLKNDAALSRLLEVAPPIITNTRKGIKKVGPSLKLRLMEKAGMNLKQIKKLLGE